MAISLTSDPIVAASHVTDAEIGLDTGNQLNHLINFASAAFLRYTNRERITSGSVTETRSLPAPEAPVLWLRATPVDTDQTFTVKLLYEGSEEETLTTSDYGLTAATGELYVPGYGSAGRGWGYQLQIAYTGGWSTVPNDVIGGALELIRLMKSRSADGQAGVRYGGFGNVNQGLETALISESVRDAWQPYRIMS